jgi:hypothetical protein
VQSSFLQETLVKETSVCPGGGQQVSENGGNERAVPTRKPSLWFERGASREETAVDAEKFRVFTSQLSRIQFSISWLWGRLRLPVGSLYPV